MLDIIAENIDKTLVEKNDINPTPVSYTPSSGPFGGTVAVSQIGSLIYVHYHVVAQESVPAGSKDVIKLPTEYTPLSVPYARCAQDCGYAFVNNYGYFGVNVTAAMNKGNAMDGFLVYILKSTS